MHRHIIRRGDAWVGVSAQKAGIDGGGLAEGIHLKLYKPQRYGHLSHPGDAFSFDMFTQAGRELRQGGAPLLDDLVPERLLAVGESQSAAFLATYANAIDPLVQVFDGFLLHGRPGTRADLNGTFGPRVVDERYNAMTDRPEQVRSDVRVPVLLLSSETDVTVLLNGAIQQPDGGNVRVWELPGASHADTYLLVASRADGGQLAPGELARMLEPTPEPVFVAVETPINSAPHQHYVAQAALEHLNRWARHGEPPPAAPGWNWATTARPADEMNWATPSAASATRGSTRPSGCSPEKGKRVRVLPSSSAPPPPWNQAPSPGSIPGAATATSLCLPLPSTRPLPPGTSWRPTGARSWPLPPKHLNWPVRGWLSRWSAQHPLHHSGQPGSSAGDRL